MKRLFHASQSVHKWFGLVLAVYLVWMGVSGVLLNHPGLIAKLSVPAWLIPDIYDLSNWNRGSLKEMVFPRTLPGTAFVAGKLGVWKSEDGGARFEPMGRGLPRSPYYKKTSDLFLWEDGSFLLLASTDGGLFLYRRSSDDWLRVPLGPSVEKVVKVVRVDTRLLAFTESAVYASPFAREGRLAFRSVEMLREDGERRVSMVKLFFDLHSGEVWGLPGRLLYDVVGLVLVILSVTSVYTWFYRRAKRRRVGGGRRGPSRWRGRVFRFLMRYHLKLGVSAVAVLLVIAVTGLFMRPPLLVLIAESFVPAGVYPGPLDANPWHEKIRDALYDPADETLLIAAADGLWRGPADLGAPFRRTELPVPLFVMGPTVFRLDEDGRYLIGSFNGLYRYAPNTGRTLDLLTGEAPGPRSPVRPAEHMITGYLRTPDGLEYASAHEQGLMALNADPVSGPPEDAFDSLGEQPRMALWNYLFELHNGRMFKAWVSGLYILITPIGALLLFIALVTGLFDWSYTRLILPWRAGVARKRAADPAVPPARACDEPSGPDPS